MADTYLLIAGAWHGGWSWRPVAARLRAAGHTVLTPTMPGLNDGDDPTRRTFQDVVDHVVDLVRSHDLRDVTLVAHSWGGTVAAAVIPKLRERIRKIVFWAAFVPGGLSLFDDTPPEYGEVFAKLAAESGNNTITMPYEAWAQGFINDGTPEVQQLTYRLLTPHPMQYITNNVEPLDVGKLSLPISYLYGEEAISLPAEGPFAWTRFAERAGAVPVLVPGSHEALFTRPDTLAEAFLGR